jgi:hypothetical protein
VCLERVERDDAAVEMPPALVRQPSSLAARRQNHEESPRSRAIRIFSKVDVNDDGSVTQAELKAHLATHEAMGFKSLDDETTAKMFSALDVNHDGTVSLEEWAAVIARAAVAPEFKEASTLAAAKETAQEKASRLTQSEAEQVERANAAAAATKASKSSIGRKKLKETEDAEATAAQKAVAARQQAQQEADEAARKAEQASRAVAAKEIEVQKAVVAEARRRVAEARRRREEAAAAAAAAAEATAAAAAAAAAAQAQAQAQAAADAAAAEAARGKPSSNLPKRRSSSASTGLSRNVLPSGEFFSSHVPATARDEKKKRFMALLEHPAGSPAGASTTSEVLSTVVAGRLLVPTAASKGKECGPAVVQGNPFPKLKEGKGKKKKATEAKKAKKKKPKKVKKPSR